MTLNGLRGSLLGLAAAVLWVAGAGAEVTSHRVELLGSYPVVDYNPWVGDVAGYVDPLGREFALLAVGDRVLVLDCTDPSAIVEASSIPSPPGYSDLKDVRSWSHYLYAAHETGGILIVDLSDPYAAVQVGEIPQADLCYPSPCDIPSNGGCHNLYADELGYLYVAGVHFATIRIYDLSADPTDPPLVDVYEPEGNPSYFHDMYAKDGILYAARPGGGNEFDIVAMGYPGADVLGSLTYPELDYAHSCWATDDHQYLLTCDEGHDGHLFIWDISDPANAIPLAEYQVGEGSIHNVQVYGTRAYIAYYEQGLRVLDISDPSMPVEVGFYEDSDWDDVSCSFSIYRGLWGIYAQQPSRNLYVSEMCGGGLHVLRFQDETSESPDPADLPDRIGLSVAPNPARGSVRIEATRVDPSPMTLGIYDASGRRVRSLDRAGSGDAEVAWTWDRRDDGGEPVATGVYYARLSQGRRALSKKIVVSR